MSSSPLQFVNAVTSPESVSDPIARNVVEWAIFCSKEVDFQRYVAFTSDHPSWPNIGSLRRCAETALWRERPIQTWAYFDKDSAHREGSLRWLALCCWMANGPKRRNSFARLGVTTTFQAPSKRKFWMFSET